MEYNHVRIQSPDPIGGRIILDQRINRTLWTLSIPLLPGACLSVSYLWYCFTGGPEGIFFDQPIFSLWMVSVLILFLMMIFRGIIRKIISMDHRSICYREWFKPWIRLATEDINSVRMYKMPSPMPYSNKVMKNTLFVEIRTASEVMVLKGSPGNIEVWRLRCFMKEFFKIIPPDVKTVYMPMALRDLKGARYCDEKQAIRKEGKW